jgi:hypothetical protein
LQSSSVFLVSFRWLVYPLRLHYTGLHCRVRTKRLWWKTLSCAILLNFLSTCFCSWRLIHI